MSKIQESFALLKTRGIREVDKTPEVFFRCATKERIARYRERFPDDKHSDEDILWAIDTIDQEYWFRETMHDICANELLKIL